jgi:glycosyltransferase involved in cell wall biosynthesis
MQLPDRRPPEPMRILHVINMGVTCGGAERLVAGLAAAQRAGGHAVRVLASDRSGGGVPFSDVTWAQPASPGIAARLTGMVRNPAARAALAEQLRTWRPDVVHLHTVGLLSPTSLRELRATPTVLTVHGPELFVRSSARWCLPADYFRAGAPRTLTWWGWLALQFYAVLIGPLWRRELRVVDLHLAPSRYLEALLARDFRPTRVVPNGMTAADPVVTQGADGRTRVVFAGRLERFKGAQVLVDAVPYLLESHPDARFVICGAGPMLAALRSQVERLGVGHAVELTGWLDPSQVHRRIAEADIVVVPSIWPEAFGLTCIEAFAAGAPVVASSVGALPELVRPDVTGLLVPPQDARALAAALDRLISDPALRRRLGDNGRTCAAAYGMQAHSIAVLDAYTEAVRRSGLDRRGADRRGHRAPRRLPAIIHRALRVAP